MSDIVDIINGKGRFIDDISFPDMVHIAFVRSNYSRAKILHVNGGYLAKDFPYFMASAGEGATDEEMSLRAPVLASTYAAYLGEPIAVVTGKNRYEAEDNLEGVEVDYDPLNPILDPEEAINSDPVIPGVRSNVISDRFVGRPFSITDADLVLEDRLENRRVATNPIETRGVVAAYDGSKLTVWTPTQSVHSVRDGICESMNLPKESVRVVQTDTGGAFGLKGGVYPEYIVASTLAMKLKRPVKWIETRREHLMASRPGRGVVGRMKIYAMKTGLIRGISGDIIVDAGAYGGASWSSGWIAYQVTGPYAIKEAYFHARSVMTNKVDQGPYRGAGRPEASFLMERMIDLLCDETGIDALDLRLLNSAKDRFKSPTGMEIEPSAGFISRAFKKMGYRQLARTDRPGISAFVLIPAVADGESCRIRVKNGRISVWLGGVTHGQRHDLWVKSLLSEKLGIDPSIVTLELGDTDMLREGVGTWGSRSAIVGANALLKVAAKIMESVRKKTGSYSGKNLLAGDYDEYEYANEKGSLISFGANLALADSDDLGNVKIRTMKAYYDVGKALAPQVVISQIRGGAVQGAGQVLSENLEYDRDGQLMAATLSDSGVLNSVQAPDIEAFYEENPSRFPHGAKGLGESPTIGVPTALVRAIERSAGIRIRKTPVTPENIVSAKLGKTE